MSCIEKVMINNKIIEQPCNTNKRKNIEITEGPGTELKKILSFFGIHANKNCSCNSRLKIMNQKELETPGWCEQNIDIIVGWLREEAAKRKLPFFDMAGRILVRRAISNARKVIKNRKNKE